MGYEQIKQVLDEHDVSRAGQTPRVRAPCYERLGFGAGFGLIGFSSTLVLSSTS